MGTKNMNKYETEILKRFDLFLNIMSIFLKFALDSSSYKSKTITEINASIKRQNEILKSMGGN